MRLNGGARSLAGRGNPASVRPHSEARMPLFRYCFIEPPFRLCSVARASLETLENRAQYPEGSGHGIHPLSSDRGGVPTVPLRTGKQCRECPPGAKCSGSGCGSHDPPSDAIRGPTPTKGLKRACPHSKRITEAVRRKAFTLPPTQSARADSQPARPLRILSVQQSATVPHLVFGEGLSPPPRRFEP